MSAGRLSEVMNPCVIGSMARIFGDAKLNCVQGEFRPIRTCAAGVRRSRRAGIGEQTGMWYPESGQARMGSDPRQRPRLRLAGAGGPRERDAAASGGFG